MQGTVVMLMALSGLGCHNKSCDVVYAPPTYSCFSGGCYANVYPPDYVSPSCYSGCYSSGYSGCYSGLLRRLLLGRLRRTSWVWAFCQAL